MTRCLRMADNPERMERENMDTRLENGGESERFRVEPRLSFDSPQRRYWVVVETVGIHEGKRLTMELDGIHESREGAEHRVESLGGAL